MYLVSIMISISAVINVIGRRGVAEWTKDVIAFLAA